jgi:oligoribonuclease
MLVWVDLETTGLDDRADDILEIAAIVTDDNFNEVARWSRTLNYGYANKIVRTLAYVEFMKLSDEERAAELKKLSEHTGVSTHVLDMHWKNGLWVDCAKSEYHIGQTDIDFSCFLVDNAQERFVDETGVAGVKLPQLAGSTISFDRGFLTSNMTYSLKQLHYRNVDVSTLNELAKRFWPELYAARPNNENKAHRGMADIEESVRVCKFYVNYLRPNTPEEL